MRRLRVLTHTSRALSRAQLVLILIAVLGSSALAQVPATVRVEVRADGAAVADAEVVVNGMSYRTPADGVVSTPVTPGTVAITVLKDTFALVTTTVTVASGQTQSIV